MRLIFTDGMNSLYHVLFGILAAKYQIIVLIYVLYQCIDINEMNIKIDFAEFFIGFLIGFFILTHAPLKKFGLNKIS